jgi:hypothetical protein
VVIPSLRGSVSSPLTAGRLGLCAACALILVGCGYRPLGTERLPDGIRRVHLASIANGTYRPGIEGQLGAAILRRLQFATQVQVVPEPSAEAVLGGRIATYQNLPIAFQQTDIGQRFLVRLTLQMTLTDRQKGKVLLKEDVVGEAYYTAGAGAAATRAAEEEAAQRAVQDLAARAVDRLLEDL